ncbi:hydrolase 1, exosortase A system-associated [Roseateles oligotrophus]|uniref:Hydrolase 1, exosortase A system-associated n=1 Tax=Roseateles oligotrophus TaxID=1769250 RepID=A0ABT2YFB6_9BURK|nr:hydrolase 1, exosortase A system-associated [Roseateles oligotrophus]MCV2368748.1 hydrolase 1, exosortase A system-associated [Roseateles oligotrophus]
MNRPYVESVLNFHCEGENLLGIVSTPKPTHPSNDLGVVIVVGGPQYRAGSHRLFVQLARSLASKGFATLRFDYRGMGDSSGLARDFLAVTPDIKAAIDALMKAQPHLNQITLWGLCDGASASLLYFDDTLDDRVKNVIIVNPWVRSAESLARTQVKYYYLQRLRQPEFWRKLFSGKVPASAISGLGENIKQASRASSSPAIAHTSFQTRMARALSNDKLSILLILSGQDYTAKEFIEYSNSSKGARRFSSKSTLSRIDPLAADHTFSSSAEKEKIITKIQSWLNDNLTSHKH